MKRARWYWHRLWAMGPSEVAAHVRKKVYQWQDARRPDGSSLSALEPWGGFPRLPRAEAAPSVLREALARDARHILAGRWVAFGHLQIQVDDPPRWHKDYLVGQDLATDEIAFRLNHRELPGGADIKLIWELSRWYQLVRLAMAAYVLDERTAAETCLRWLSDWVKHNPPCRGWNWTSGLEVGLRLVQFTWIDALLRNAPMLRGAAPDQTKSLGTSVATDAVEAVAGTMPALQTRLDSLAGEILPPHAWHAWRHRSFGSSANNHLIGELVGLILAVTRWPELATCSAPLDQLQRCWEREVLAQFAEDGGTREQALNYHLFSWELCWQARMALTQNGRQIDSRVDDRLGQAARFFCEVQARGEPWVYGDSDDAMVAPFFLEAASRSKEWRDWVSGFSPAVSMAYWLGVYPTLRPSPGVDAPMQVVPEAEWRIYPDSGVALFEAGLWWLRWDLSPLGYLKTAAHGHLDALHLSIWFRGTAMVIDPGTGAYYADSHLRDWLASREAHNGPCPRNRTFPRRLGPFLWSHQHAKPKTVKGPGAEGNRLGGEIRLPGGRLRRAVQRVVAGDGWEVFDEYDAVQNARQEFSVRWQFAPGALIKRLDERRMRMYRDTATIDIEVGPEWSEVILVEIQNRSQLGSAASNELEARFAGTVSPAFRKVEWAPFLKLIARPSGDRPCTFRTKFLACRGS